MRVQVSPAISRWRQIWGPTSRVLLDLVYPSQCAFCRDDLPASGNDIALCGECLRRMLPAVSGWCLRCSAPLEGKNGFKHDCPHCKDQKFQWEAAVALGRYRGELSRAVVRTKSARAEALTVALTRLLLAERGEALVKLRADLVAPMPMHWARRLVRGVNGPERIAEVLARGLGMPLKMRALQRRRLTPLQTECGRQERHENQRQSFRVANSTGVIGRRVLLVDDVLTS